MHLKPDLIGQKFGRMSVTERKGSDKHRYALWLCRCDCGTEKVVRGHDLKWGKIVSCGCYQKEVTKERNTKHGHCVDMRKKGISPELRAWYNMVQRCTNPNATGYEFWGGRGITICERWENFENFLEDLGPKPSPEHSLDRIDPNGNYEPENCRWADEETHRMNKRDIHAENRKRNKKGQFICD